MRLKDRSLLLTLIFAIFLTALPLNQPVFSSPLGDAQSELEEINRKLEENQKVLEEAKKKETGILGEIAKKDDEIRSKESELSTLNKQLSKLNAESDQTSKRLEITEAELELNQLELKALQENLLKQTDLLARRLRSIYKDGDLSFIQVLLKATDFSDLLTRIGYLSMIADQDTLLLERIKRDKAAAEKSKIQIEARQKEIEAALLTLKTNTKNVIDVKALTQIKREQISVDLKAKKVLLTQVQRDRAAAERIEAELERSSQELTAYIRSLESGEPATPPTGPYRWPTNGPITSGYGMRFHPILKVYKMHTGIDIGAPYGQNICASQGGTVIFAGWQGGYGRTMIIDHGGGISTLYAHTSALNFNVGQRVEKGDIIGHIGSTGYSTGPHLHFEIRQEGEPKNPMNWF